MNSTEFDANGMLMASKYDKKMLANMKELDLNVRDQQESRSQCLVVR